MEWYYAQNDERFGPVTEEELNDLIKSGRLGPSMLVWREGWSNWVALADAGIGSAGAPSAARCVECGQAFATREMVQYEGFWVCPTCKPIFFQKVKEGIEPRGALVYAGFWIRFVAKLLDGIILQVATFVLQLPFIGMMSNPDTMLTAAVISWLISFALQMAYYIVLTGKYGATIGKMACGLKVVMASGGKVSYGRATGRAFAEILSGVILAIGYIMAAFDDEKRTLHDRICETRVIRSRA